MFRLQPLTRGHSLLLGYRSPGVLQPQELFCPLNEGGSQGLVLVPRSPAL